MPLHTTANKVDPGQQADQVRKIDTGQFNATYFSITINVVKVNVNTVPKLQSEAKLK
jgi:hypothetical protein